VLPRRAGRGSADEPSGRCCGRRTGDDDDLIRAESERQPVLGWRNPAPARALLAAGHRGWPWTAATTASVTSRPWSDHRVHTGVDHAHPLVSQPVARSQAAHRPDPAACGADPSRTGRHPSHRQPHESRRQPRLGTPVGGQTGTTHRPAQQHRQPARCATRTWLPRCSGPSARRRRTPQPGRDRLGWAWRVLRSHPGSVARCSGYPAAG
jgi:hypothetical protein